jgi:hypothetical protein
MVISYIYLFRIRKENRLAIIPVEKLGAFTTRQKDHIKYGSSMTMTCGSVLDPTGSG